MVTEVYKADGVLNLLNRRVRPLRRFLERPRDTYYRALVPSNLRRGTRSSADFNISEKGNAGALTFNAMDACAAVHH